MKTNPDIIWNRVGINEINLAGVKAAVVGGTGGLGRAISRQMVARGASVIVVGQTFRDADVPGMTFVQADLSLMQEAKRVAAALPAEDLDLVVFTTGIFAAPQRQETHEGIERDLAVSYLSRLVILREIAPRLKARTNSSLRPRVFIMGYPGTGQIGAYDDLNAEKSYNAMAAHMNTVAGNEMLVLDAVDRYPQIRTFGLNPGLIKTNIRSNFMGHRKLFSGLLETVIGLLSPSPELYAENIVPLLVSPDLEKYNGVSFNRKGLGILPSPGMSADHIRAFLSASGALVEKVGAGFLP